MQPTSNELPECVPDLHSLRQTAARIAPYILQTPQLPNYGARIAQLVPDIELSLKQELMQKTGSFKARGAINVVLGLDGAASAAGITAFSAGNHAIATAYAAHCCGVNAKVVMPASANPYRVAACKAFGAEVMFGDDIAEVVGIVQQLERDEGRTVVHPFEGRATTEGTATIGLELCDVDAALQAVVVPVGGGGLISGIAAAVKRLQPGCKVYGVEPMGACGMQTSLQDGAPLARVDVDTIADSLGAPLHLPYSYSVVEACVDDIVSISDDEMRSMMRVMFEDLKLAVEPAGAAALAAIAGPLKSRLCGQKVAAVLCGSNIDIASWHKLTA